MMTKHVTWRWMGIASAALGVLGGMVIPTCAEEADEVDAARDAKICWVNLKALDAAKEQATLENCGAVGDPIVWEDIIITEASPEEGPLVGYLTERPVCPSGAPYLLMPVGCNPICTSGLKCHSLFVPAGAVLDPNATEPDPLTAAFSKYTMLQKTDGIGEVLWSIVENESKVCSRTIAILATLCLEPQEGNVYQVPKSCDKREDALAVVPADAIAKERFDLGHKVLQEFLTGGVFTCDDEDYYYHYLYFSNDQKHLIRAAGLILQWNRVDTHAAQLDVLKLLREKNAWYEDISLLQSLDALGPISEDIFKELIPLYEKADQPMTREYFADLFLDHKIDVPETGNRMSASRDDNELRRQILRAIAASNCDSAMLILSDLMIPARERPLLLYQLLNVLEEQGPNAKATLPALKAAYEGEDFTLHREKIMETIRKIDPSEAITPK